MVDGRLIVDCPALLLPISTRSCANCVASLGSFAPRTLGWNGWSVWSVRVLCPTRRLAHLFSEDSRVR